MVSETSHGFPPWREACVVGWSRQCPAPSAVLHVYVGWICKGTHTLVHTAQLWQLYIDLVTGSSGLFPDRSGAEDDG